MLSSLPIKILLLSSELFGSLKPQTTVSTTVSTWMIQSSASSLAIAQVACQLPVSICCCGAFCIITTPPDSDRLLSLAPSFRVSSILSECSSRYTLSILVSKLVLPIQPNLHWPTRWIFTGFNTYLLPNGVKTGFYKIHPAIKEFWPRTHQILELCL